MHRSHDASGSFDSKASRKLEDQRRMQFRRAIETYTEQRRLADALSEFPELAMISRPLDGLHRRNAEPVR